LGGEAAAATKETDAAADATTTATATEPNICHLYSYTTFFNVAAIVPKLALHYFYKIMTTVSPQARTTVAPHQELKEKNATNNPAV
jgi:hypothetical protein